MSNLISPDNLYQILRFFVPGLIVIFVRAQFVAGRTQFESPALLSYFVISIIYYALALPFVDFALLIEKPGYGKAVAWLVLIFFGPAALGLLLGVNIQKNLFHRLLQWFRLNPVHVVPTAWDWKFGGMTKEWVLVTLKDGTRFAGFCGSESFMSSDPTERDIYIQWIYDIDDDDNWTPRGENGVLVAAGEVQTIEFWPYLPKESANDHV